MEEAGFAPIELVMGTSYFHIGYAFSPWGASMEIGDLSQLMLGARMTAMSRMVEHAKALGADGVVAIRMEMEREGHHAEFTAIGTAVRRKDGSGAAWHDRGFPFTCASRGEDFWALVRGGFRPTALVHGVCVYHVAHQTLGAWLSSTGKNVEQPQFTQALYDARELAMERVQRLAKDSGASGIVGLNVSEGSHGWSSHVIEFVAVGTGVAPLAAAPHEVHAPPVVILSATDA